MSFEFQCQCGKLLSAEEAWSGKHARCPECGIVLTVPQPPDPEETSLDPGFEETVSDFDTPWHNENSQTPLGTPKKWQRRLKALKTAFNRHTALNAVGMLGLVLLALTIFLAAKWFWPRSAGPQTASASSPAADSAQVPVTLAIEPQVPAQAEMEVPVSPPMTAEPIADEPIAETTTTKPTQEAVADSATPQESFTAIRRQGLFLPTGEELALFLEPLIKNVPTQLPRQTVQALLADCAFNDADLWFYLEEALVFSHELIIQGKPAAGMLHILVFPHLQESASQTLYKNYRAGNLKYIHDLEAKYGPPEHTQPWSVPALNLQTNVQWWAEAGFAANPQDGRITHILLRSPMKRE